MLILKNNFFRNEAIFVNSRVKYMTKFKKTKEYLVITIDVEADYNGSPIWYNSSPLTFEAVTIAIPKKLQPLFNKYKTKPTYLLSNLVLEDRASVSTLKELDGEYELGAHLHGDYIEPQKRVYEYAGAKAWDNQCQYSYEIEYQKMQNLTKLFRSNFDCPPVSFRAGRYSAAGGTISILEKLGYKADCSITPYILWKDQSRQLDFRRAYAQPYYPSTGEITKKGNSTILEVPVSIKNRIMRKPIWLRPTYSQAERMIDVIRHHSKKYAKAKHIVHNMMFHNVEVQKGVSPFTTSDEKCAFYLSQIEAVLQFCSDRAISFVTLSELYDIYTEDN